MYSFIKKVVTSVVSWTPETENNLEDEEESILDCIKSLNVDVGEIPETRTSNTSQLLGQSDLVQYDVETLKCVQKTGKVTHLCDECGLIDNVIYFKPSQVKAGLTVKPNDEVLYTAYRAKENEAERIFKVYALKNDPWEVGQEPEIPEEEINTLMRCFPGRVTKRRGREVYIESFDIWCNLDKVEASFIPIEGDWVELSAPVAINENVVNLSGEVLEVKSLKPLLEKSGFGRVTFWSELKREGAIENSIYFTSKTCEVGYVPGLGDEIGYDAVASDQDRFKWRAVKILVSNLKKENAPPPTNHRKNEEINSSTKEHDPFCDKNNIIITPSVCSVQLELYQTKTVAFKIANEGTIKHHLSRTTIQSGKNSQLTLMSANLQGYFLLPKESVLIEFRCEGKTVGLAGEVVIFYFNGFKIAKRFEINVTGNKEMNKFLPCKFDTAFKVYKEENIVKDNIKADLVLYGPKPWKPPKFLSRGRKLVFNIPKKLWSLTESSQGLKYKTMLDYAPYLKTGLNFEHYADRFHTLLYLEEIDLRIYFRKFDLNGVYPELRNDYFVLEVPGLVERRPSVIFGDKIVLSQPWSNSRKTNHVGYIHDIRAKEIFIKFHNSFHESYKGDECNIVFEPNTNFFSKCHDAINRAVKTLGETWLFPSAVNEKPPQIFFTTPEEKTSLEENVANFFKIAPKNQEGTTKISEACDLRQIESSLNSKDPNANKRAKNLAWVNKRLNERQKLAVVSVLRGQGRPLPYIIFGPPGTGKTVTLVEIIIQIYRLIPNSRILVTTPSNSAADLICERLIDLGNFKPGQLVRLLALYRVHEGLVPAKLIPYSTFHSYRETHFSGKNISDVSNKTNIRGSTFTELAGMHRITVSTCVTIGGLHYLGLLPGHFTHILVDEAGQTSEPELLISATFQDPINGQVILTGDPQQLGPVICSNLSKSFGLGISLLQRLISTFPYVRDFDGFPKTSGYDPRFITKLNINYRTVPEILSLPSQLFYNSDLVPTVSQTDSVEADIIKKFNFLAENRDTPPAIIFHGIIGQNYQEMDSPSWFNPHEIWQVVFYVRKLYSIGLDSESLGIVSPYSKQVQKLKYLLSALKLSTPKIGSVEEFQGQERNVIIVTTVRSSAVYVKSDVQHSLGFVASPQRLNVALTRARALLIIVGNPFLLSRDPYWVNVVKYCVKNNSYTGCHLGDIFGKKTEEQEMGRKGSEGADAADKIC